MCDFFDDFEDDFDNDDFRDDDSFEDSLEGEIDGQFTDDANPDKDPIEADSQDDEFTAKDAFIIGSAIGFKYRDEISKQALNRQDSLAKKNIREIYREKSAKLP